MLELADNPSSGAVKYRWLSIIAMGFGFLLTLNALFGLGNEHQTVKQLIISGVVGGFLIGLGFYLSAILNGRMFLSPILDRKKIQKEISSLEQNT